MTTEIIRKARIADVNAIHGLIALAATTTPVIPRSRAAIYETLRDFYVSEIDGEIKGCCALHIVWDDLAEIKSLSIHPDSQGKSLGRKLATSCLAEARELRLPRVFALTAAVPFFEKIGFSEIDKCELPHKVWGDCINCPKFPDCDEVAVLIKLRLE